MPNYNVAPPVWPTEERKSVYEQRKEQRKKAAPIHWVFKTDALLTLRPRPRLPQWQFLRFGGEEKEIDDEVVRLSSGFYISILKHKVGIIIMHTQHVGV